MAIFWAGDEESWNAVTVAEGKVAEGQKQGRYLSDAMESELPPLWNKAGNIGVIEISGSLVDGSAGWMRLFGVNGYEDIINAARAAAADPGVDSLLFNVSSGGGDVHGLADFAIEINAISKTKPSLTYTKNTMASAAYWSGSSVAGPIIMGPTAEVGSLGILQVQRNISKQLEMQGISMTIHRAGNMKARVNPIEELTAEAKAHLDEQLGDLHSMFKKVVAKNRPQLSADELAVATDGRTFLGQRAIKAGLADSIGSFDLALKLLDKGTRKKDTSQNSKGAAMHMSPQQIAKYQAAIAAGHTIAAALDAAGVVYTAEQLVEMEKSALEFKAEQETAAAAAAATAAATQAAADAAAKAAGTGGETANDLLKAQLSTASASLLAAQVELTNLKATTQSMTANHDGLLAIARKATAGMMIPLGGSGAAADTMDAATVITEHARVSALFLEKFKPGQATQSTAATTQAATEGVPLDFRLRAQQLKN